MFNFDDEPDQEKRSKAKGATRTSAKAFGPFRIVADMEEEFLKHILAFETAEPDQFAPVAGKRRQEVPPPMSSMTPNCTPDSGSYHRMAFARSLSAQHQSSE